MCLSDLGLDVQASGAPSGGQPAVGVEQLQIDGFGKRESQQVEHVGRGARGERLLGRYARARRAHLTDGPFDVGRSEEHTSELQSRGHLVCRLLLEKKKNTIS